MSIPQPPATATKAMGAAVTVTDNNPRCWKCGRRLGAYLTRPWFLTCHRCKTQNGSPPLTARQP